MKKTFSILQFLMLLSLIQIQTAAAIINETNSTPEIQLSAQDQLLISEVNFKNTTNDTITINYNSTSQNSINLKGLIFKSDSTIKTIEQDFIVHNHESIQLTLNSNSQDDFNNKQLYTIFKGLTGTMEQIMIQSQSGKIFDAVCWSNAKPTAKELKDLNQLYTNQAWSSNDPKACIQSDLVHKNQSIFRNHLPNSNNLIDTNSSTDWAIQPNPTTPQATTDSTNSPTEPINTDQNPQQANPTTQTPAGQTEIKNPINLNQIIKSVQPILTKKITAPAAKKAKTKKVATTKNSPTKKGDLSNDIFITEIMPNPDQKNQLGEWVELSNLGTTTINLGNWQIDDDDGGSKSYIIPYNTLIKPETAIVFSSKKIKINLANLGDHARLFNPDGKLMQDLTYEQAPKNRSYGLHQITTSIENQPPAQEWLWEEPTPGLINQPYEKITGTITAAADFSQIYSFTLQDQNQKISKINFDEKTVQATLAKVTFTKDTELEVIAQKDQTNPNEFNLKKFTVIKNEGSSSQSYSLTPMIILVIIALLATGFILKDKIIKKLYSLRSH